MKFPSDTKRRWLPGILTALISCMPTPSFGGSVMLNLQKLAGYSAELPYQKAFTECELATSIPDYVAKAAAKKFDKVALVDEAGQVRQGLALAIQVVELDAPGGGGWSGDKGLTIEGRLYRDGTVVETFRKSHRSKGHSVGLIKASTCSILNSDAQVLANQMVDWVKRKLWTLGLED